MGLFLVPFHQRLKNDAMASVVQNMGIDRSRVDVFMPKELLDRANVIACF
jgi:hypothetical protein